jgi:hypothetical protein
MADTRGLVQQLKVYATGVTIALVGPTPTNVTTLFVERLASDSREEASAKDNIVGAMSDAMVTYREVVAVHASTGSAITQLRIEPV